MFGLQLKSLLQFCFLSYSWNVDEHRADSVCDIFTSLPMMCWNCCLSEISENQHGIQETNNRQRERINDKSESRHLVYDADGFCRWELFSRHSVDTGRPCLCNCLPLVTWHRNKACLMTTVPECVSLCTGSNVRSLQAGHVSKIPNRWVHAVVYVKTSHEVLFT